MSRYNSRNPKNTHNRRKINDASQSFILKINLHITWHTKKQCPADHSKRSKTQLHKIHQKTKTFGHTGCYFSMRFGGIEKSYSPCRFDYRPIWKSPIGSEKLKGSSSHYINKQVAKTKAAQVATRIWRRQFWKPKILIG